VDRAAAFYIIVLGEHNVIVGSPAAIGLNLRALRAVWTLVVAFCLNWLYVNGDGASKSHVVDFSPHCFSLRRLTRGALAVTERKACQIQHLANKDHQSWRTSDRLRGVSIVDHVLQVKLKRLMIVSRENSALWAVLYQPDLGFYSRLALTNKPWRLTHPPRLAAFGQDKGI
jgi:hypothetical protein